MEIREHLLPETFRTMGLPIYNPYTTRQDERKRIRDPFPGNIIPFKGRSISRPI